MNSQQVIVIVGPSGSGKSTLESMLVDKLGFKKAISFTTRKPREGEIDGVDYHFVGKQEAMQLIQDGQAVEHIVFNENIYGVLSKDIQSADRPVVIVAEPNGVFQIKEYCAKNNHQAHFISLFDDISVLINRVVGRYSKDGALPEDIAILQSRIKTMMNEEIHWHAKVSKKINDFVYSGPFNEHTEDKVISLIKASVDDNACDDSAIKLSWERKSELLDKYCYKVEEGFYEITDLYLQPIIDDVINSITLEELDRILINRGFSKLSEMSSRIVVLENEALEASERLMGAANHINDLCKRLKIDSTDKQTREAALRVRSVWMQKKNEDISQVMIWGIQELLLRHFVVKQKTVANEKDIEDFIVKLRRKGKNNV